MNFLQSLLERVFNHMFKLGSKHTWRLSTIIPTLISSVFVKDLTGTATCSIKSGNWELQRCHGLHILKACQRLRYIQTSEVYCYIFHCSQCQWGVPSLVIPNAAKVDLAHLKAYFTKYAAAAGFGSTTTEWWLTSLEDSMRQLCDKPMQELLDFAKNRV